MSCVPHKIPVTCTLLRRSTFLYHGASQFISSSSNRHRGHNHKSSHWNLLGQFLHAMFSDFSDIQPSWLWIRCYFHYSHFTGEKNWVLGRSSKLLKAPLWVSSRTRLASRASLLTAHSAACVTHSTIMKTQRNGRPSKSFPFRRHSWRQYTSGSLGGTKDISTAINQKQQMAYCSPDFFNLQEPNKCLVMELKDNKIKMKPWGK